MAADGLPELGRTSLLSFEAGDEVAGLAFELVAVGLHPFADDPDQLAGSGKGTDVLVQIDPGDAAPFDASVVFFPAAQPFIWSAGGEAALGELMEGGLVVLEAEQIVAAMTGDDEGRFFGVLRASPVTRAPSSWPATS